MAEPAKAGFGLHCQGENPIRLAHLNTKRALAETDHGDGLCPTAIIALPGRTLCPVESSHHGHCFGVA
jgi:hypothetical protein